MAALCSTFSTMHNPWTKAIDLQQWAPKNSARFMLPALVRRLIWATTKGKNIFTFPSEEGVQRPSWDGRLNVDQGNVWVPKGSSVWEISTGSSPASKAQENYAKRTASTPAADAAQLVFIFVTPQKWIERQAWADEKKAEGIWADIHVLDSDDLEHWLEIAPAVDIWLARFVDKVPVGVRDLSNYWENLAGLTQPPLPADAFLAGRQQTRTDLSAALAEAPREIPVAASSEQEMVDYLAAAFGSLGEDDALPARLVLVESQEAWDQITTSTEPLVLTPSSGFAIARNAVAQAIKAGHHVITRRPYATQADSGVIRLPRAWRHEVSQALIKAGFLEERATRLSGECGGYLAVLQRLAVPNSGTTLPIWAQDSDGALLAPFVLFGAWDDAKSADRELVANLTGRPYEKELEMAAAWLTKPESPFRRTGSKWHVTSREDTWIHLAPRLTRAQLDTFASLALSVLSEDDPRFELDSEERVFASIHGKVPRYSGGLREGLAETVALLGAELVFLPALPPGAGQGYARRVVGQLLAGELTTHRWFTLSPILKLLAEAAPEEFLSAVERDVFRQHPALPGLYEENDGGIFGSSRHYYVMWALTSLAWHPSYLARTALILARLAALDPGGRMNPRPSGSLHDIFRPWFPQTAANPTQRFEVIDLLTERETEQAWKLLMAILPTGHDSASGTTPPRWLEWPMARKPIVSRREEQQQWEWTSKRLFKLALPVPERLLELTGNIDHLHEEQFQALVTHLKMLDTKAASESDTLALWNCLQELIRSHTYFTNADWRMSDRRLDSLREVELHLRPKSPVDRHRWLFAQHHIYIGTYQETSHEEQEAQILECRKAAIIEIFSDGAVQTVAAFASSLEYPGLVGDVLARSGVCPDVAMVLPQYLDGGDPNISVFGRGYASVFFNWKQWEWVETLSLTQWSAAATTELLFVLPFSPRARALARSLGSEVEGRYWSRVWPFIQELTSEQASVAIRRLLEHGRPLVAADFIRSVYYKNLDVPASLLAQTLEECVPALNKVAETKQDVSHLIHNLGKVLKHLQDAPENDSAQVAGLEWTYLPLMRDGHASPKYLQRDLGKNAASFVQCIELIYRKDGSNESESVPSEADLSKARLAKNLLDSWTTHPALNAEGGPDELALRVWVDDARNRCALCQRVVPGDAEIGKLLASAPPAVDGSWPCVAVRNILESIPGETALDTFETELFNNTGGTSRGIHAGGDQERQLAREWHRNADACQMRWPRVSTALRSLAQTYEYYARHMDDRADDHI